MPSAALRQRQRERQAVTDGPGLFGLVDDRLSVHDVLAAIACVHDTLDNPTPQRVAAAQMVLEALEWRLLSDYMADFRSTTVPIPD